MQNDNETGRDDYELKNSERGPTPFDDVFKTETVRLKEFLIPLINELYGTTYDADAADIERESNEHYLMSAAEGSEIPHRLTDSCIRLGGKLYNIECQSLSDGSILVRLVEYNMQIGLENAVLSDDKNRVEVELPRSALLMLRGGKEGERKSEKELVYRHDDQEIRIKVPVMYVQAYSQDEIYDKHLYFLIPFYAMRYEKAFEKIAKKPYENEKECDIIYSELNAWFERLENASEIGDITEEEGRKLADMSRVIMSHITRKLSGKDRERMVGTMGGRVLELYDVRCYKQGIEDGREEGRKQGRKEGRRQGRKQGIKQGIKEGSKTERAKLINKFAAHYMQQDKTLTEEKAREMVEAILK